MTILSRFFAALFLAASFYVNPAYAAAVAAADCPVQPVRFVVLGDSLADGLWGSIFRTYAGCGSVETVRLTAVSDGLAKTGAEGWLARYAGVASAPESRGNDVVIVQIGANDITTIREGRTRESFSTQAWDTLYSARVAGLTSGLRAQAPQVIWLGLPIVGKSRLEGPYQTISKLQRAAVRQSGGIFVDIHNLTMFGTGAFAQNGTYLGRLRQLRAADKVHFTKLGYDYVAEAILGDLAQITLNRDRRAALQNVPLQ